MAETRNYVLQHTELAEMLIKHLDIHEGLWGIYVEFGLIAANVPTAPDGRNFLPAAISTVNKVGLQRFDQPSNLTVDASVVNPVNAKVIKKIRRSL